MTGNNVALAIVTVALVLLIYFVVTPKSGVLSTPRPRRFGTPNRFRQGPTPDLKDVGQQLYAVMAASFQRRRLLSRSEYDTFKIIEDDMRKRIGTLILLTMFDETVFPIRVGKNRCGIV